jgi:hypothetical protein
MAGKSRVTNFGLRCLLSLRFPNVLLMLLAFDVLVHETVKVLGLVRAEKLGHKV